MRWSLILVLLLPTAALAQGVYPSTDANTATYQNKSMSGANNTFSAMPKPKFNVLDYGASNACYLTTTPDSTAAFQNAFNAAAAVGGTVYIPAGFYCTSKSIVETGPTIGSTNAFDMSIEGDGGYTRPAPRDRGLCDHVRCVCFDGCCICWHR